MPLPCGGLHMFLSQLHAALPDKWSKRLLLLAPDTGTPQFCHDRMDPVRLLKSDVANVRNMHRCICVWRHRRKRHRLVRKIVHIYIDSMNISMFRASTQIPLHVSVTLQPSCSNTFKNFLSPCVLSICTFLTIAFPPLIAAAP